MLLRNACLIDPEANRTFRADIQLRDGRIAQIRENGRIDDETDTDVIDAAGCLIGPGLVDTHVHFRDPGFPQKEDIFTGAAAAAAGGYTGVVMMANTRPCIDNPETLRNVLQKGKQTKIRVFSCANVTVGMQGEALTKLEELSEAGAVGFTDDGIPLTDAKLVQEAMMRCAALHKPLSFHEEDPALISENGIHRGRASDYYGIGGSPREAEISLIARDLSLAGECKDKVTIVIQHISTKEGTALVREAKRRGLDVHAEATPHHFTLTEDALIKHGSMAKMNPPLRTAEDRAAIREGLRDGTIDLIATDHAPHTTEEKSGDILKAPSGIIGLETALSLAIRELIRPGILSWPQLFRRMSLAPARLYGIPGGTVRAGDEADLVIFHPEKERIVRSFVSRSQNSPFLGETLPGVVEYTICRGEIVYRSA